MEPSIYLPKRRVIDVLWEARAEEHEAQLRQLRLALQWALLHPCGAGERPASWGEPGLFEDHTRPLAGAGAPLVAAQAPLELAAALDRPVAYAEQLLADALELAFRLPRLWELLGEGQVAVWTARLISRETHDLDLDAALHADRLLCAVPAKIAHLGVATAARLVQEARLHADPDRSQADEDAALAYRGVWVRRGAVPATSEVTMTLDAADAALFDQSVSRVAADLKTLGDADDLQVRRARAVGVLADPQHALDLMSGREDARPSRGGTGAMDLVLHVHPEDLQGQDGVAVAEQLGAVSVRLLTEWLARHLDAGGRVTLRPVIDLADASAGDAHDPSPRLREQVVLRDAHCVFPGCRRDSRGCDLDHIDPYVPPDMGGPPGQTTAVNLAPLCRRHHNAKTHRGWTYHRRDDGSYTWTSPTSRRYDVIPASRTPLRTRQP